MAKIMKTISVDSDIVDAFDKLGLNRSQICEDAMKTEIMKSLGPGVVDETLPQCAICGERKQEDRLRVVMERKICAGCWTNTRPFDLVQKLRSLDVKQK